MGVLDEALATAALVLPDGSIERIARALETIAGPGAAAAAVLEAAALGGQARVRTEAIARAWEAVPALSGPALALALRTAAAATAHERSAEIVEIAWTGPSTPVVPMRRSASILLDLIAFSRRELVVVSFAAYKVPAVLSALSAAATRGVEVRLILEDSEASGGALSLDAKAAFVALRGHAEFYSWPADQRGRDVGHRGALHAKAVIADGERALVTSANLTGNALDVNMELGLLVEGGPIPKRLSAHFAELMMRGVLRQVD